MVSGVSSVSRTGRLTVSLASPCTVPRFGSSVTLSMGSGLPGVPSGWAGLMGAGGSVNERSTTMVVVLPVVLSRTGMLTW